MSSILTEGDRDVTAAPDLPGRGGAAAARVVEAERAGPAGNAHEGPGGERGNINSKAGCRMSRPRGGVTSMSTAGAAPAAAAGGAAQPPPAALPPRADSALSGMAVAEHLVSPGRVAVRPPRERDGGQTLRARAGRGRRRGARRGGLRGRPGGVGEAQGEGRGREAVCVFAGSAVETGAMAPEVRE